MPAHTQKKGRSRHAVVIGATGNLGGAIAAALQKDGYEVDPTWMSADHPDASKEESYRSLPPVIDMAVYCAGVNIVADTEDLKAEDWDRVLDVNLRGAFLFAKAAFAGLKASKSATFIVISSINATHPYPKRAAYAASKAGLEGLARELSVEWGKHGIAAHAIRLGHLDKLMKTTPPNPEFFEAIKSKTPLNTLIPAGAVADYVAFLGSGFAPYVSGHVTTVDPAYTINRFPL